ncbi:unnamed protein product [Choristocarpus tenellus]
MSRVGVKSTFHVRGEVVHQFVSDTKPTKASLLVSPTVTTQDESKEKQVTGRFDYTYTGRHDHGDLPPLKSGGVHGELIQALQNAKADSDTFLTELIERHREQKRECSLEGSKSVPISSGTGSNFDGVKKMVVRGVDDSADGLGAMDTSGSQASTNTPSSSDPPTKRFRP